MPGGGTFGEEPTDGYGNEGRNLPQADERLENEGIGGEFGGLAHDQR